MSVRDSSIDLGIRDRRVEIGDHIAYFWERDEEFAEAVQFLEKGAERDEHLVVFGHEEANERVLEVLAEKGHAPRELRDRGLLSVLGPESSGDRILGRIGETFQKALDSGAELIRLLGNIGWGRETWPDQRDLLRFEAQVTSAASEFPCVVVCMYDIDSLSGSVVFHGALRTHPLTIHRNVVRENPMCEGVEEYLAQLEARHG